MTVVSAIDQARRAGERLHPFHGGLRLRHHKKMSVELPLERPPLPPELVIPLLQQAVVSSAEALVQPGQQVLKGELIGHCEGAVPASIHASTSGTVIAVERRPMSHPSGLEGVCVVIRPDGRDRWMQLEPIDNWHTADPAELVARVAQCGIVGLGGAMFPTGEKADAARHAGVHTLILNGAECEPYISCDEMLMREQPDRIVAGARVLQRASGAETTIIAIEDQMDQVFAALQAAIDRAACDSVRLVKVTSIYPDGGEKQLIQVLTGLEVPAGGLPIDLGLLCQNVATAAAVADAVIDGKPLIERIVTVTGNGVQQPRNLLALVGTPISFLVDQCGGYLPNAARLVLGGPMMGFPLASDANPVTKAANCVLVLEQEEIRSSQPEMPCIRCGACSLACPAQLLPQTLHWQVSHALLDQAEAYGLWDCIECGCCDYVCPSQIPLAERFRRGKAELRTVKAERARAVIARERHEARESRLARIEVERRQQAAEKKAALGDRDEKKRRIAEAIERAQGKTTDPPDAEPAPDGDRDPQR